MIYRFNNTISFFLAILLISAGIMYNYIAMPHLLSYITGFNSVLSTSSKALINLPLVFIYSLSGAIIINILAHNIPQENQKKQFIFGLILTIIVDNIGDCLSVLDKYSVLYTFFYISYLGLLLSLTDKLYIKPSNNTFLIIFGSFFTLGIIKKMCLLLS